MVTSGSTIGLLRNFGACLHEFIEGHVIADA